MGSIRVSGLGKAYKQYPKRWSRAAEWLLPFRGAQHELKWVLKDVNFDIAPGEAIGLIGVNGAGKSTLLKLITGTTSPTTGAIEVQGRIAALLELGIGFHPDFTGRQNAVISGQLQGLNVEEITALMPEVEAFAGIGSYIDEPVRVYSSGMQMRLAFSVATCIRPDILIVDEALAVGDVFFQQKCFDRIDAFARAGTTLLFVSHSSTTILNICSRCLLLRDGVLAFDGPPKAAIDLYQADMLAGSHEMASQAVGGETASGGAADGFDGVDEWDLTANVCGSAGSIVSPIARCLAVQFVDGNGGVTNAVLADQMVRLKVVYWVTRACDDPHVGFKIRNRYGSVIFETNTYCMRQPLGKTSENSILSVEFSFAMNLLPEEYTVTVGLSNGGYAEGSFDEILSYLHEVVSFSVVPNPQAITWAGVVNLNPQVRLVSRPPGDDCARLPKP
jgi:lipopolysaccharide transport system ATP-binding protein